MRKFLVFCLVLILGLSCSQLFSEDSLINPQESESAVLIEAESYLYSSGVQIEDCRDGGRNVGWIDEHDWMFYKEYDFNESGYYTFYFRVASLNGGGILSLELNGGSIILGKVDVPKTDDWQEWTTISYTAYVDAGAYNVGISADSGGWNLNWFGYEHTIPVGSNLIRNGNFEQNTNNWDLFSTRIAAMSVNEGEEGDGGEVLIDIADGGSYVWSVQLSQTNLNIERFASYEVSFKAGAAGDRTMSVKIGRSQSPWESYSGDRLIQLTTGMTGYTFTFTMAHKTDARARLEFNLGTNSNNVIIDTIQVKRITGLTGGTVFLEKQPDNSFVLFRNNEPYYIKGIGGTKKMAEAKAMGANSVRTWHSPHAPQALADAEVNDMTVLQGLWLTHDAGKYFDENYKNEKRRELQDLLDAHKNSPALLMWGIGNEVNLGADTTEAWQFINELAGMVQEQDPNHPAATIIHKSDPALLNTINTLCPNIDVIGVNAYGTIETTGSDFAASNYDGPYMITEWGPDGHWEVKRTAWDRPLEQNSSEKAASYSARYDYILSLKERCLGSYVFLWGQKQERTPTWYGMMVEERPSSGLYAELCPTVDVMELGWSGTEPENRAPVVHYIKLDDKWADWNVSLNQGQTVTAEVTVSEPDNDSLTYVWEVLVEPTVLNTGGGFEPRPDTVEGIITGSGRSVQIRAPWSGHFRVFVYVLDGKGKVGTANIPFRVW